MKIVLFTFVLLGTSELVRCADILAVIPTPFYSHQATFRPLWRELAKRGHKITLITTHPMESNENITQLDYSKTFSNDVVDNTFKGGYNFFTVVKKAKDNLDAYLTNQFNHPELHKLVKNNKTFDLMMVELIMPGWPILSVKFKCPFIGLSTMDGQYQMHEAVGNAMHPAIYPYADLGIGENPSIKDRFRSTALLIFYEIFSRLLSPVATSYIRSYIDEDLPDALEAQRNVSLIFINSNPAFFPPRPVTPTTINLGGGLHLTQPKELPLDLQKYLDESEHGCIYVSFGTTVNSKYLSEEQKQTLVQAFQDMAPMRVLWKFDDVNVAKNVKNIEVRTWLPQQDVLRHRNLKLFVTQGGLQSMEEAIDSAVPMLGMPFYGDQYNNVLKMKTKKFGLSMDIKDMTKESLTSALKELLNNPIYRANINKYSAISKDQPMRGLEKAVWWTEYVLRHGGTEHLRSPSADIPLYQYFFLDILAITSVFIYIFYVVMKYFYRMMMKLTYKYIFYPLLYKPKAKKE